MVLALIHNCKLEDVIFQLSAEHLTLLPASLPGRATTITCTTITTIIWTTLPHHSTAPLVGTRYQSGVVEAKRQAVIQTGSPCHPLRMSQ